MSIKIIFIISVFTLLSLPVNAQTNCLAIATEPNMSCKNLGKNYTIADDQGRCGYVDSGSLCCCEQSSLAGIAPKYIIMGSVAAALGAVAIISFALKKREVE